MFDELRAQFFPYELPAGVIVRPALRETVSEVQKALMDRIFPRWNSMNRYAIPEERRVNFEQLRTIFNQIHREDFVFYDVETPIGWSFGRMENAFTYRMNNTGLLPEYRRKGVYTAFTRHLLDYLKALGYETVVSYHHPTNRAVLNAKLKLGFNITGTVLSAEVGATVQMTHFFYEDHLRAFEEALSLEPDMTR